MKKSLIRLGGLVLALGVWTSCLPAGGGHPRVEDYDNSCTDVSDCTLVQQSPGCCGCASWHGLHAIAAAEFEADQERYWNRHQCRAVCAIGCMTPDASQVGMTCEAGTCQAQLPEDSGSY